MSQTGLRQLPTLMRYCCYVFLAFSLVAVTGCGGCGSKNKNKTAKQKKEEEEKKKQKKKQKPAFEHREPFIVPGQEKNALQANRGKGGHWINAQFPAVSNRSDFDGTMEAKCVTASGRPVKIDGTNFYMRSTRPVSLPKEQWKNFETTVFLPLRNETGVRAGGGGSTTVDFRINSRSGAGGFSQPQGILLLREYQFHFVVLSAKPEAFTYLKVADFIKLPDDGLSSNRHENFYHLVYAEPDKEIPLPSHPLAWTTIAYILWNDLDPDLLSSEQQTALIDWLHWGGQIILSGPDCLDRLSNSFLADYLPAKVKETANLTAKDIEVFNENWSIQTRKNKSEKHRLSMPGDSRIIGAKMELNQNSSFIEGTDELVAERLVGRGRVVTTAFSLHAKPLLTWKSLSGFYQTVLLRRPVRKFDDANRMGEVFFTWENGGAILDPMLGSTLRYVSRDLGMEGTDKHYHYAGIDDRDRFDDGSRVFQRRRMPIQLDTVTRDNTRHLEDQWHFGGYTHADAAGVGGWNDFSGVSIVARDTLGTAAGITPPSRNFVLRMLMIYLAVLVPANWLIFKLIGRVEWAWVMAPIISIVGAVGVAKFASLDIGFVRSSTTVGVLELHSDYPRGHLTNYTALYTSLSTDYDVEFANNSALVLPFSKSKDHDRAIDATINDVRFEIGRNIGFNGFPIQSNTSERYHSENMVDVGGSISYRSGAENNGSTTLLNQTKLEIHDAAILRRDQQGQIFVAWLGEIAAGQTIADPKFVAAEQDALPDFWKKSRVMYSPRRHAAALLARLKTPADEIPLIAVLDLLQQDPETKDSWEKYEIAARKTSSIAPEQKRNFPDLLITEAQLADICELANDDVRFRLGKMLDLFLNSLQLDRGEARLIGWTEQKIDDAEIKPSATQATQKTMVLVHLKRPTFDPPKSEQTIYSDFTQLSFEDDDVPDQNKPDGDKPDGDGGR